MCGLCARVCMNGRVVVCLSFGPSSVCLCPPLFVCLFVVVLLCFCVRVCSFVCALDWLLFMYSIVS